MEFLGFLLAMAVPAAMVTAMLLPIVTILGPSRMWRVAVLLAAIPIAWIIWASLYVGGPSRGSLVILLLVLPIPVIAGTLHFAHVKRWSTKAAAAVAVCVGAAAFVFGVLGSLRDVYMGGP